MLNDMTKQRLEWLDEQTKDHEKGEINPWVAVKAAPLSRPKAIRCACYNCVGGDADPNPTGRIKTCAIVECPLYLLRPYRIGTVKAGIKASALVAEKLPAKERVDPVTRARGNPQSHRLAVRAYCWQCMGNGGNANTPRLIATCETYKCGLWDIRPYQELYGKNDDGEEAPGKSKPESISHPVTER